MNHIDIPGEELVCPECGKGFASRQGVGAHRARAHGYRTGDPGPLSGIPGEDVLPLIDIEDIDTTELRNLLDGYTNDEGVIQGDPATIAAEITSTLNAVIEASSFGSHLQAFLPHLAFEALERIRQGDSDLAEMFLMLYLDGQ